MPRKPQTVLIGWELGANRGHVIKLGAIAGKLHAYGLDVAIVAQRPDALRAARAAVERSVIYQAPIWPGLLSTAGFSALPGSVTYGDILADLGLRDSGVLEFLIRAWDALLAAINPVAVIGEFAPALLIAAHGRVPSVATGTGFTVPPSSLARFPSLLNPDAPPCYDEQRLLAVVNRAAERAGRPGYDRLPQIAAADVELPAVFSELDPYAEFRSSPPLAPFLSAPLAPREIGGDEIFVYLGERTWLDQGLLEGLVKLAGRVRPVRAYIPALTPEQRAQLTRAGAILESEAVPFADIARCSRLAVTEGGIGFTSAALACGLPLAILPSDLEKLLTAQALDELGTAQTLSQAKRGGTTDAQALADAIAHASEDISLATKAAAVAPQFRTRLAHDPADGVADVVRHLIGAD